MKLVGFDCDINDKMDVAIQFITEKSSKLDYTQHELHFKRKDHEHNPLNDRDVGKIEERERHSEFYVIRIGDDGKPRDEELKILLSKKDTTAKTKTGCCGRKVKNSEYEQE